MNPLCLISIILWVIDFYLSLCLQGWNGSRQHTQIQNSLLFLECTINISVTYLVRNDEFRQEADEKTLSTSLKIKLLNLMKEINNSPKHFFNFHSMF